MKSFLFISIVIFFVSCKSNAQEQQGLDEFANELSMETFNKMIQSCPIDFEQSKFYQYSYQGHYDIFKNAGICRLFEIKDSADFQKIVMKFKKLKNKNVTRSRQRLARAFSNMTISINFCAILFTIGITQLIGF
jgi:hypothetical protein